MVCPMTQIPMDCLQTTTLIVRVTRMTMTRSRPRSIPCAWGRHASDVDNAVARKVAVAVLTLVMRPLQTLLFRLLGILTALVAPPLLPPPATMELRRRRLYSDHLPPLRIPRRLHRCLPTSVANPNNCTSAVNAAANTCQIEDLNPSPTLSRSIVAKFVRSAPMRFVTLISVARAAIWAV